MPSKLKADGCQQCYTKQKIAGYSLVAVLNFDAAFLGWVGRQP
jgi:hypothetical protein